ncbi:disease resistance protein RPP13-like isoform X2 [Panicum hallii]|uniref:disease resistance protein RPP13-like isoform X2 n=1 Tax=Panicum hallii TaxID=206008 RepID=UPI000DF4D1A4|nr:disease resistance protein RPP13-like isoform X2 [Panicum hallii]
MEVAMGLLSRLILKVGDLLVGEYKLQNGVKGEIMFLHPELESMQGALEEIATAPPDQLDKQDRIWASEVRELCYDIEDSIDTFVVRCAGGAPAGTPDGMRGFIHRSLDLLTRLRIRRQVAADIRDIKRRVVEAGERRERYRIDVARPAAAVDPRLLAHYRKATELVGIDEARDEVISILMEGDDQVSNQHGKGLLYELGKNVNDETLDERQLIDQVRKFLQTKRYCIVIDDIWSVSIWDMIRCALPDGTGGYIIITTTRIFKVAEQVGGAYKMKPLCLDSSRKLLYGRIFSNDEKYKCHDEFLAEVSDRILKKCAGVPLAIVTIASLLANRGRNKMEWYEVCNSIGTGLEYGLDVENMRKILAYSYYDLPSHLRTCLLYLSVFPEDYAIEKFRLIWMWIAEGFVQHEVQGKGLYELGECYFNELINKSLIQPVYDRYDAVIEACRVHDMVLDLVRSISSEENFVTMLNNEHSTSQAKKVRRLLLQSNMVDHDTPCASMSMQQVRSVVAFSLASNLMLALGSFRVLRVLDLGNCYLPQDCDLKHLGNLFHLRYLGVGKTSCAQLPDDVGNLRYLQTLDLVGTRFGCLPSTVVQLRHLMCLRIDQHTIVPNGIGRLTSLEDLSTLYICDSTNITEELCHLTELRVLEIFLVAANDTLGRSLVMSLCKLQKMQSLTVWVSGGECNFDAWVAPRHLRSLQLQCCWFSRLPDWMAPSLLDLTIIQISVRELHQDDLKILGRLPALRHLYLMLDHENLKIPRRFVIGTSSFPCLVGCRLLGFLGAVMFQQGAMMMLTSLAFTFHAREVREITSSDGRLNLGLENLVSLQDVLVYFRTRGASEMEVEEAKAALSHAFEIHPNQPNYDIWC